MPSIGVKIAEYLSGLFDVLVWRLARGSLAEGRYVSALRLANRLIDGCKSESVASSSSSRERDMYKSLGWRLRAVAVAGIGMIPYPNHLCLVYSYFYAGSYSPYPTVFLVGDFVQAGYCCSQMTKYSDQNAEDIRNATSFVEKTIQNVTTWRANTELPVCTLQAIRYSQTYFSHPIRLIFTYFFDFPTL